MAKITGVGGFFFKSADPSSTGKWMTENLGMPMESWGKMFPWLERETGKKGYTVLGLHSKSSDYFTGSAREFMLNLRVDDLDGMLARCKEHGVEPIKLFPEEFNGRFAHILDPEGRKVELWQPKPIEGH